MKNTLFYFLLFFVGFQTYAQQPEDYFITTWKFPADREVARIPTAASYTYDYIVDWGDGTPPTTHTGVGLTAAAQHTYATTGVYTIKIYGTFPTLGTAQNFNLISIDQWGTNVWQSMKSAFKGYRVLATINATDTPDLSQVTDMSEMFRDAGLFNADISGWDVSNVTNMNDMFASAAAFNQNLGSWDVSNVTTMLRMLLGSNLSVANYDALLNGWATLQLQPGIQFQVNNNTYFCNGETRRANIQTNFGWRFFDGGKNCLGPCTSNTEFVGGLWTTGAPDSTKRAIFSSDFTTTANMEACSIEIKPGVIITVAAGHTLKVENDLVINGELIFESNATGNGELAQMGPKAAIIGEATVERYMSAHRSYRMVSPAVTTTTSIRENWQEGANNTSTNYTDNQDPKPGFGTHITGSQTGANGFDATQTGNPSMFTVNVATQQFQVVPNTNVEKLTAGNSYLMMVRGDRNIDLNDNNAVGETTLRATGKLMVGNKAQYFVSPTPVLPATSAFVMFGNPYQSAVDMSQVVATSTNVNTNHYYVYDPTLADYGGYVTVALPSGTTGIEANQYLQPGQGAQLATLGAGTVLVDFREAYKTPGQHTSTNATGTTLADGMLTGSLYTQDNYAANESLHDAFAILFSEDNDNGITQMDAVKPFNFYENFGIDHNGTYLSVEKRELPEAGENFQLYTNGYAHTEYVLKMELNGLENVDLYLDDHFTEGSTLLEQGFIAYPFTIDSTNPESKATDRFSIRVAERLSVNDNTLSSGITLYPNPMDSQLNLGNPNNVQLDNASIYDLTGRLIKTVDLKGATSEVSIDISELSTATYMVVIDGETGQISRLMVKK